MNYSDITNLALTYADRKNDPEAVAAIDSMLRLVESNVNRGLLTMASASRTSVLITDANQEYYDLPDGFASFRSIKITSDSGLLASRTTLQYVAPSEMDDAITSKRHCDYFTIEANKIWIRSTKLVAGNYIEYVNYADLIPLSAIAPVNWLSESYPDCYVLGLATELFRFTRDWDSFARYKDDFYAAIKDIDLQDDRLTWSGGPLATKVG